MVSQNVTPFFELLDSPVTPTFIRYIREVELFRWSDQWGISLGQILDKLSNSGIRPWRLHLNDCDSFPDFKPCPSFSSSVLHLEASFRRKQVSLTSIVNYICAFPLLEHLILDARFGYLCPFPMPGPLFSSLPPTLHTVEVSETGVLYWIASLDFLPPALLTIVLHGFGWSERKGLHDFLQSPAAAGIRTLKYDLCEYRN
jgi:hypothetical protein